MHVAEQEQLWPSLTIESRHWTSWALIGGKKNSFEERIEELKTFKEKHGHVRATVKQDKSLGAFCRDTRSARC